MRHGEDPRVDAYIAKAADFAKPILKHLRQLVHAGCPGVVETMKWGMPHFDHKGILCGMAAFKAHSSFGFWKGELILGRHQGGADGEGMGHFGKITSLADLPDDKTLLGCIRRAVALNDAGVMKPGRPRSQVKPNLVVPAYFTAALKKNKTALATFAAFSYSHKKEYVEWITEAKRAETRARRIATAMDWLAHGKARNWKYANG
ncbi:MAG: hypothetical protein EXS35_08705 [Pedosphaera sp.]|nr:hypothetical protein [Pedosphaera sp.]